MKSVKFILPAALALAGIPTPASAGIYTDDLSKCVVRATTASDKQLLMKWMFSAFSSNLVIASLSKVAPGDHESFDKSMALIVERLLLSDCRKEAIDAIKYEGGSAIVRPVAYASVLIRSARTARAACQVPGIAT